MDIEITFDAKYEAACAGLAMYEDHEIMPDGDWIRFARRVTGIPELFMYHHKRTGNYVFAKWLFKPDVCLELECFDTPPDRGGWMSASELKARCSPVDDTVRSMKDKMRLGVSQRKHEYEENELQKKEAIKMLYKQGNDVEARNIATGKTPWIGAAKGGASYARTCETLRQMAGRH